MDGFLETIRVNLDKWGELMEILLNLFSLLCIVAGVVVALVRSILERLRSYSLHPMHTHFRMLFGGWLVVAL